MLIGVWLISLGRALEPGLVISKIATVVSERIARATAT
jgi:hypothetical protein